MDIIPNSVNHNVLYLLFESQNLEYVSRILKGNQYPVQIRSKLQGYITGYCISHCSSTAEWEIDDRNNDLLQSMITGTSSGMGGMITSLVIRNVSDYSKCLQMLYKLEHYTKRAPSGRDPRLRGKLILHVKQTMIIYKHNTPKKS